MIYIRFRHLLVIAAMMIIAVLLIFFRLTEENVKPVLGGMPHTVYVIDAGHGGEDGGAVAPDGTVESGINLSIASRLDGLLTLLGDTCVMTRTEDRAIYDSSAKTIREKKVSDIKNRVALVNQIPNSLLISIHQNMLPSHPDVFGAQVFYAPNEASRRRASVMQQQLNQTINGEKNKQEKPATSSIYLLNHIETPGVLIECGFLSNPDETRKLKSDAYQKLLAITIAAGIQKSEGVTQ